nr:hypothetical protein [Geopsychrobacter electrodiphilus]
MDRLVRKLSQRTLVGKQMVRRIPLANDVFDPDAPMICFYNPLTDGKAESAARLIIRATTMAEFFEQSWQ